MHKTNENTIYYLDCLFFVVQDIWKYYVLSEIFIFVFHRSPIEFWLPPSVVATCGQDTPPCDNGGQHHYNDSNFFEQLISPFMPYTLGWVLWDQAERDVHCLPQRSGGPGPENHTRRWVHDYEYYEYLDLVNNYEYLVSELVNCVVGKGISEWVSERVNKWVSECSVHVREWEWSSE